MPAISASHATDFPGLVHADFVVGDRDGTTASPALSALVCEHLRACGYSVEYNHPYKGVELVRRYSAPAQHRHSIQLEINRKLTWTKARWRCTRRAWRGCRGFEGVDGEVVGDGSARG